MKFNVFKNQKFRTKIILLTSTIFIVYFIINFIFVNNGLSDMEKTLTTDATEEMNEMAIKQAIDIGRSLTIMAEGIRKNMANLWENKIFNRQILKEKLVDSKSDDYKSYLGIIPIVASMRAVRDKAKDLGIKFKVPKIKPRNKDNEPTSHEIKVLESLKAKTIPESLSEKDFKTKILDQLPSQEEKNNILKDYTLQSGVYNLNQNVDKTKVLRILQLSGYMDEYYEINKESNTIDYYKAVRLDKICLLCHGDPNKSQEYWGNNQGKDPTGVKMEDWKEGEIHGAFKLTLSLDKTKNIIAVSENKLYAKGDEKLSRTTWLTSIINVVIIIIGLFAMFISVRLLTNPIGDMKSVLNEIAKGDFTKYVAVKSKDEIGQIANDINTMESNLSKTLVGIDEIASNLAASSEELSSTTVNLSDNAQNQSANVEETVATLHEFSESIQILENNTQNMMKQGLETLDIAKTSLGIVEKTISGMNSINDSSSKIVEIVRVINDIADQTNLLSLNASIEAARAGEHGRGFSVVAEEISKLAEKSIESSKTIEELVKESQNNNKNGGELINQTGLAFKNILSNVEETTKNIEKINDIVSQQTKGTNQIQTAMNNVNEITQNQSAGLEQMSASFSELASHAEKLKSMMDKFKFSSNGNSNETKGIKEKVFSS
ncbi:MAG: methyl-accepting chemotaxis protein [Spirochaetota bacterium]|nr:methyl-accepting chemotaxis protein [Spirochaetota bacterium]